MAVGSMGGFYVSRWHCPSPSPGSSSSGSAPGQAHYLPWCEISGSLPNPMNRSIVIIDVLHVAFLRQHVAEVHPANSHAFLVAHQEVSVFQFIQQLQV